MAFKQRYNGTTGTTGTTGTMTLTMPQRSCNAFALCTVHAMPPCLDTTSSARNGAACGRPATQKWTLETHPRMAQTVPGAANRGRCGFGSFRVLGWIGSLSKLLASFYVTCLLLARFCLMSDSFYLLLLHFTCQLLYEFIISAPSWDYVPVDSSFLAKIFLYQRLPFTSTTCRANPVVAGGFDVEIHHFGNPTSAI